MIWKANHKDMVNLLSTGTTDSGLLLFIQVRQIFLDFMLSIIVIYYSRKL